MSRQRSPISSNFRGLLLDDYVIVHRGLKAGIGDIVVALVDGEYTVKYLEEDDGGFYLKAGNKE